MKQQAWKWFAKLVPALTLAGCMWGCMDSVNTIENTDKSPMREEVRTKRVVTDGILDRRLITMRTDKQILPSGLMEAQVTLKSSRTGFWSWLLKGNRPYKIVYKFTWFNASGIRVQTASSVWLEKDVMPGDTFYLQQVAPNEQCRDFMLHIREHE